MGENGIWANMRTGDNRYVLFTRCGERVLDPCPFLCPESVNNFDPAGKPFGLNDRFGWIRLINHAKCDLSPLLEPAQKVCDYGTLVLLLNLSTTIHSLQLQ